MNSHFVLFTFIPRSLNLSNTFLTSRSCSSLLALWINTSSRYTTVQFICFQFFYYFYWASGGCPGPRAPPRLLSSRGGAYGAVSGSQQLPNLPHTASTMRDIQQLTGFQSKFSVSLCSQVLRSLPYSLPVYSLSNEPSYTPQAHYNPHLPLQMASNSSPPLSPTEGRLVAVPSAMANKQVPYRLPPDQYTITWDGRLVHPKTAIVLQPIAQPITISPRHTAPPLPHSPILSLARPKKPTPLSPDAIATERVADLMFEVASTDAVATAPLTLPVTNRKRLSNSPTVLRKESSSDPLPTPRYMSQAGTTSSLSPQSSSNIYAVMLTPLTEYEEQGCLPVFEEEFMVRFPASVTQFTIKRSKKIGKKHLLGVSSLADVTYLLDHSEEIKRELRWQVSPLRPRAPCIQLTNFYYKVTEDFLLRELFNIKNEAWHNHTHHMANTTIVKITPSSVVIQLPPELWHAALTAPAPRIAMFQPAIQEYIPIQQCFRCSRFGHTSSYCTFAAACFHCGGGHEGQQCAKQLPPPTPACANCMRQRPTSILPPHTASNHGICPLAQARKRDIQAQTIYNQQEYEVLLQHWQRHKETPQAPDIPIMEDQLSHSAANTGSPTSTPHIHNDMQAHHGPLNIGHAIHNSGPQYSYHNSHKSTTHHHAGSHNTTHVKHPPPKQPRRNLPAKPSVPTLRPAR